MKGKLVKNSRLKELTKIGVTEWRTKYTEVKNKEWGAREVLNLLTVKRFAVSICDRYPAKKVVARPQIPVLGRWS